MNCEYCNKQFSNKGNLNLHQKTAKYCLELRELNKIENKGYLQCEYCKSNFSRKSTLTQHLKNCKEKDFTELTQKNKMLLKKLQESEKNNAVYEEKIENLNQRIADYKSEVKDLMNQLVDLADKAIDKPTYDQRNTTNNNTKTIDNRVLNMVPMDITQEHISKILHEKFTENHLMKGQKGVADFCLENNILINPEGKYLMKCTDPSRKMFIYIDEDGKLQKDVNANRLTNMLNEPVKEVTKKIYDNIQDRYFDNQTFDEIEEEKENPDEEKLNFATTKVIEITNLKRNNSEFIRSIIPPLTTN